MNKKHVLCLVLSLLMLVSAVFPAGAFADDFFSEEPVFVEEQPFVEDSYFTEDTPSEEPAEDIGITEEQPGEEIFVDDFIEEPVDAIVEDAQGEDAVAEEPAFTEELIEEAADEAASESAEETAEETEVTEEIMETVSDTESFEAGPTISTQPQSQSAQVGDAITFTVKATGSGTLSYQWYYRTSSTGNWTAGTTASAKTDKYKVTVKAKHDGYQYYVKVTDSKGSTDSNVITLTVGGTLVITSQPVNSETAVGSKAVFTVGATGVKTYQWQYKTATATKWANKTSADGKTESISIKVDETRYDYKYRCKLVGTDGKTYYTNEVQIVKPAGFAITSQPVNSETAVGGKAVFTVEATGVKTYQWQYKTATATKWANKTSADGKTESISIKVDETRYGYKYRCKLVGTDGKTYYTDVVQIVKPASFAITSQPVNSETAVGGKAVFTVEATGVKTYQWQYKTATATKWADKTSADGKTASISIKVDETRYGYKYRCKLVGTDGKTYYTDEVQIVAPASPTFDSGDFTFLKTGDQTCTVKKYNGSAASVTVPETANSCTVVGIEAEAFMGNTTLKSIDLPDTITVIGARAFKGCTSLSEMK